MAASLQGASSARLRRGDDDREPAKEFDAEDLRRAAGSATSTDQIRPQLDLAPGRTLETVQDTIP